MSWAMPLLELQSNQIELDLIKSNQIITNQVEFNQIWFNFFFIHPYFFLIYKFFVPPKFFLWRYVGCIIYYPKKLLTTPHLTATAQLILSAVWTGNRICHGRKMHTELCMPAVTATFVQAIFVQARFVQARFVLVTFVHIRSISAVTDTILTKLQQNNLNIIGFWPHRN